MLQICKIPLSCSIFRDPLQCRTAETSSHFLKQDVGIEKRLRACLLLRRFRVSRFPKPEPPQKFPKTNVNRLSMSFCEGDEIMFTSNNTPLKEYKKAKEPFPRE